MSIFVKDQGTWHEIPEGGGGLPGLGGWADVTAVTGSPTKHEYTDAGGNDWTAYEFTADGTVTTTSGLVEAFVVAGGGGGCGDLAHPTIAGYGGSGGAGGVAQSVVLATASTHTVTVGTGGAGHTPTGGADTVPGNNGGNSRFLSVVALGGGRGVTAYQGSGGSGGSGGGGGVNSDNGNNPVRPGGAGEPGQGFAGGDAVWNSNGAGGGGAGGAAAGDAGGPGIMSAFVTGSPLEYARGGDFNSTAVPRANSGSGGGGGPAAFPGVSGADGVVCIRVPRANAKA